ncbi:MAG: ATP-binding cassette domain-containing protein [Nitrospirota bacterium]|nr:ATP-binding cassette domain-containing protein [Nitrospirota bacterium]MDH5767682.1 ATP-binding cassette domain-containing protein [Nitrospirota bacterium]
MNSSIKKSRIVHLNRITKIYGTNEHKTIVLQQISFQFLTGELILLIGPSGSGKTTLLTLIAGLTKPTTGTVSLFERNIEHYTPMELQQLRAKRIGFIFQTFLLIDSLTAIENVEVVLRFIGKPKKDVHLRATQLLNRFHIEYLSRRFPPTMSQGEKQRVAVARAVANNADLILADEPTGSLESKQGFDIIRLLQTYAKEQNKCVIVASHDLRLVEYADQILRLEDGMLREMD